MSKLSAIMYAHIKREAEKHVDQTQQGTVQHEQHAED